jgi:hypothetical protein
VPSGPAPGGGSFAFAAAGDMGCSPDAAATLEGIHAAGVDFALHFGDMAYDQAAAPYETTWCNFVKDRLGADFPYEIVTGGHDLDEGPTRGAQYEGSIDRYTQCVPDRMGSTSVNGAGYGKEYFFDHPAAQPLARLIMISPSITMPDGTVYDYTATPPSPHYQWLADTIDSARAAGIRWVIVGMARDCITAGEKQCEIGQDVFNLLVDKKVDLILQGHEHGYERSKQLASGPACPAIPLNVPAPAACIANDGTNGVYVKGDGAVIVIAGTLGIPQRAMYPQDPEAPDFAALMGGNCARGVATPSRETPLAGDGAPCAGHRTPGFVKYTVSADQITATFVATTPDRFTDTFTIRSLDTPITPTIAPPPPAGSTESPPNPAAAGTPDGYWMLGSDGRVYPFGAAATLGDGAPGVPAVHLEPTRSGRGYWVLEADGRVLNFGDAPPLGQVAVADLSPGEAVSSLAATPSGKGYWIFTNRGRTLAFGDAPFLGDVSKLRLNGPVLGSVATPSGRGYYMVASDGGIFAFGDAQFHGSMGGKTLNAPVQSLVPEATGNGYWLVASDGGIFAFDAPFKGSMGGVKLAKPVVGMIRYADGYLMVGADGGIFDFSAAPYLGSLGDHPAPAPIVSVAARGQ